MLIVAGRVEDVLERARGVLDVQRFDRVTPYGVFLLGPETAEGTGDRIGPDEVLFVSVQTVHGTHLTAG